MAARDHVTRVDPWPDPRHKILCFIMELMSFHGVAIGRAEAKARAVFEPKQFLRQPSVQTVSTNTSCGGRNVTQRRKQRRWRE
jgi:hypothetical protein